MRSALLLCLFVASAPCAAAKTDAPQCLAADTIRSEQPDGPQAVIFNTTGGTAYRSTFETVCPGLEEVGRFRILRLEPEGGQICRGDRISVVDPRGAGGLVRASGPSCRLGPLTRIANGHR